MKYLFVFLLAAASCTQSPSNAVIVVPEEENLQAEEISGRAEALTKEAEEPKYDFDSLPAAAQNAFDLKSVCEVDLSSPPGAGSGFDHGSPEACAAFAEAKKALIIAAENAEIRCKETGESNSACVEYEKLFWSLRQVGICWGKKGEAYAEHDYHPCTKDSINL